MKRLERVHGLQLSLWCFPVSLSGLAVGISWKTGEKIYEKNKYHLGQFVVEVVGDIGQGVALVQQNLVDVAPSHRVDALPLLSIRYRIRLPVLKHECG